MADTGKENQPPARGPVVAARSPLASAASTDGASRTLQDSLAQQYGPIAFPAEDPDEDADVLDSNGKTLRNKRSVLFYPSATLAAKSNQAPFSRSAAKRDSILALGSIGYLQHLYTKQGIASRNRPVTKGAMTLAIGPAGEAMLAASEDRGPGQPSARATYDQSVSSAVVEEEEESESLELPPSPKAGTYTRPKFLDVARPLEADSQALRNVLIQDMIRLLLVWGLSEWVATDPNVTSIKQILSEAPADPGTSYADHDSIEVLTMIDVTTKAIRSVRSYVLALPQRSSISSSSPNEPNGRDRYKRQSSFSAVSRPGQIGTPMPTRSSDILHHDLPAGEKNTATHPSNLAALPQSSIPPDTGYSKHLSTLRKAALSMLSALQDMEMRDRVEAPGSDGGPRVSDDLSSEGTLVTAVLAGDPDDSDVGTFADRAGYPYRGDLKLTDLEGERKVLQSYIQTVDSVLAALSAQQDCKESRKLSRPNDADTKVATPSGQDSAVSTPSSRNQAARIGDLDSSPVWTRAGLGQSQVVSSFIIDHCEASIANGLTFSRLSGVYSAENDLENLLSCLSDGYLLCQAFNEAVRRSDKPWGYIASREIHDLQAEEAALVHKEAMRVREAQVSEAPTFQTRSDRKNASEGTAAAGATPGSSAAWSRPGGTFRRTENLRVWAAALRLRYQIQTTATKATSKQVAQGPTYGSLGMGKLALHGRRVASESQASPSPKSGHKTQRTMDFDPAKVARKEDGWQEMLVALLCAWIESVGHEQGYTPSPS